MIGIYLTLIPFEGSTTSNWVSLRKIASWMISLMHWTSIKLLSSSKVWVEPQSWTSYLWSAISRLSASILGCPRKKGWYHLYGYFSACQTKKQVYLYNFNLMHVKLLILYHLARTCSHWLLNGVVTLCWKLSASKKCIFLYSMFLSAKQLNVAF